MRFLTLALIGLLTTTAAAQQVTRFEALLSHDGAIAPGGALPQEDRFTGHAVFTLTEPLVGSPTLAYEIVFEGVDFVGDDGDPTNDAAAIHIHNTAGVDHTAGTPHALNLFGFPSVDDLDALVDAPAARVTGLWDDADADPAQANLGGATKTLTSQLDALRAGQLFLMLHTTSPDALPNTGGITIGGQIVAIPEPSAALLAALALVGRVRKRR